MKVKAADPEKDAVQVTWGLSFMESALTNRWLSKTSGGRGVLHDNLITLTPAGEGVATTAACDWPVRFDGAQVTVVFEAAVNPPLKSQKAGLLFNVEDKDNFDFFGVDGETSSWLVASVRQGKWSRQAARGVPLSPGKEYRLLVQSKGGKWHCEVNGAGVLVADSLKTGQAGWGLLAASRPASFSNWFGLLQNGRWGVVEVANDMVSMEQPVSWHSLLLRLSDSRSVLERLETLQP